MLTFSPRNTARIIAVFTWINRPRNLAIFTASETAFAVGCYWMGWKWTALGFGASAVIDLIKLSALVRRHRKGRSY
jgi:hypothetical protein